jgi:FkbM family methyltransferase
MANLLKILARKALFSKEGNLTSFEEPYGVIAKLLRNREVSGILDAGASNGRISRRLLRFFPEASAYAFEPNPLYADILKEQASADTRFRPQFCVLSDCEGEVQLHITESPGTTSLFQPGDNLKGMYPENSEVKQIQKVDAVTIDGWNERNGSFPIELMKFDIQGGEVKAIAGADRVLRTSTLVVYTEILFNSLYEGGGIYSEVDLSLRKKGFVLFDIFKPRYHRDGRLLWGNAIFVHAARMGL